MKTLISADGPFQANVIKGRLESEGIAAEVINEDMGTLFPYSITDDRGIRIIVHEEDYERAMAIITQAYASEQKCPFCGSENTIRTDQNIRKTFMEMLRHILSGFRKTFSCCSCGKDFSVKD